MAWEYSKILKAIDFVYLWDMQLGRALRTSASLMMRGPLIKSRHLWKYLIFTHVQDGTRSGGTSKRCMSLVNLSNEDIIKNREFDFATKPSREKQSTVCLDGREMQDMNKLSE